MSPRNTVVSEFNGLGQQTLPPKCAYKAPIKQLILYGSNCSDISYDESENAGRKKKTVGT